MTSPTEKYEAYKTKLQEIADIKFSAAVLQWDQETYLPPNGNEIRGRQISTLTTLAHKELTQPSTGQLLQECLSETRLDVFQRKNIELSNEDYQKHKRIPSSFVKKLSESVNTAFHAWIKARKENNYQIFEHPLQMLIELKRQESAYLGYDIHPYDAHLNEYDKGLTVSMLDNLFKELIPALSSLLEKIKQSPSINNDFLYRFYEKNKQWDFGIDLLKKMHFNFDGGRQDISEHPFTTNFNSQDVRITTRIDEHDLANMIWSCIHEGGHGLYEQGLSPEHYGLPLGEYCSLSIHESQSRLWENNIGRSKSYWQHHYPHLQSIFPASLQDVTLDFFYRGINKVIPSLIRTEADELTYHFHILIRYEIEKKLMDGTISAKDVPSVWNHYYKDLLHLDVPDDKRGCLQDVHWSHGSFGYFPTYTLGSLYAAQWWNTITKENNQITTEIAQGSTHTVHSWLKKHIYQHGRFYTSSELCLNATGETLDSSHFINYLNMKYQAMHA